MTTAEFMQLEDQQAFAEIDRAREEHRKKMEDVQNEVRSLKTAFNAFEEKNGRLPSLRSGSGSTPGNALVASEQFMLWKSQPNRRGRVTVDVPNVLLERKALTPMLSSGNTPATIRVPGISGPTWPITGALQLITATATNAGAVDYLRANIAGTEHAAAQVEGALKASANLDTSLVSDRAATVACYTKASRQLIDDVSGMTAFVNGVLTSMVLQETDREVLLGAGAAGSEITGLLAQVPAYSTTADVTGDTPIDTISHAVAQLAALGVAANAVLVNGASAEKIRLVKDTTGNYQAGYPSGASTPSVWGLQVVTDKNMSTGQFLVGDFSSMNIELLLRQSVTVDLSLENEDDFVKNMMTIRAELRAILALYLPAAFLKGGFPAVVGTSASEAGNGKSMHNATTAGEKVRANQK